MTVTSITFGSVIVDYYVTVAEADAGVAEAQFVAKVVGAPAALALVGTAFDGAARAPDVTVPTVTIVTADGRSVIVAEVTLLLGGADVAALTSEDTSGTFRSTVRAAQGRLSALGIFL